MFSKVSIMHCSSKDTPLSICVGGGREGEREGGERGEGGRREGEREGGGGRRGRERGGGERGRQGGKEGG